MTESSVPPVPRNADHLLTAIVDATGDLVAAQDVDFRYTVLSESYRREMNELFGCDLRLGDSMVQALAHVPQDRAKAVEHWGAALRGEHVFATQKYGGERGPPRWYEVRTSPLRDERGAIVGAAQIARDVTARVRAEEGLRESESRYRALFDFMDEGFCVVEVLFDGVGKPIDYRFLEVNRAFERQTGLVNAAGRRMRELAPEHEEHWFEIYGRVALTGEPTRFENRAEALGRWYDVYAFRLGDPADRKVAILFNDITARHRAEQALRESEERFRTLADSAPVIMWLTDAEGDIEFVNRTFREFFGVTRERAAGGEWQRLVHPDDGAFVESFQRAVRERMPFRAEARLRRFDGAWRWVESYGDPRFSAAGEFLGHVGLSPDITDRKLMEEALREADRRKDEFMGMLSHELRNPLAPIRNSLFILDRAEPSSEQASRAREIANRQVAHLTRLVDDLLDVTRIARGKVELRRTDLDLAALVRHACETYRGLMQERGLELEVATPRDPLWVNGDETRFTQVLGNLLHNATKFTPAGGRVTVSVTSSAGTALVHVCDTGAGIEPALLRTLFDPFTQANQTLARTEGGLGLGLALVKGIVELHGGTVKATSAGRGRGSDFRLALPLVRSAGPRADDRAPAAGRPALRRRVLVVEDNKDAAATLAELVEMFGHEVDVAHDGPSAIAKARLNHPDVVLCDIGLPGMTGYDVAKELRAGGASPIKLIAVSGYAQPEDLARAAEAGFDGHIAKPADPTKIETLLA